MIRYYQKMPYSEEVCSAVLAYLKGEYEPSVNQLDQFEQEFSQFMKADYCVGVSSGSAALHLALIACGVGPGDEVVTIANSCTSVSDFILWCGAKPVFVDVEPETYNINIDLVESALTSKTKVIIPVHMYGHPCDMDPLLDIAERHSLFIIEDAAQAAGAKYKGNRVGTLGSIGIFSFPKNLGGFGGAILTNDEKISSMVRMLRHFGRPGHSARQEILGFRYTLSGLYSLINRIQLKSLDANNEKRRLNGQIYKKMITDIPDIILPVEKRWAEHVYCHFVPKLKRRDELIKYLFEKKIELKVHYSIPIYKQGAYKNLEYKPDKFPVTEELSKEVISLPTRPNLQCTALKRISKTICNFYQ